MKLVPWPQKSTVFAPATPGNTLVTGTQPAARSAPPTLRQQVSAGGFDAQSSHATAAQLTPPSARAAASQVGTVMGLRLGATPNNEPVFGSAEFEAKVDRATNSKVTRNNNYQLLYSGQASFSVRNRAILAAKESINLQTFIFTDDDTGWETARLLVKKAQEGVQVRVIYDAVGSLRSSPKIFEFMKQGGVEVRSHGDPLTTNPMHINDRWHEKHLIVDGRISVEGGMNIADEYALGGSGRRVLSRHKRGKEAWRDTDIKLQGPVVGDMQRCFIRNWESLGQPLSARDRERLLPKPVEFAQGVTMRVVQHRPKEDKDAYIRALYLQAIRSSRKSITLENAYFLPDQEMREALMDAARRGVEVRIMTNGRESNDSKMVSDAGRYFYDELVAAGVKIFEKQGGTLHAKSGTFDGVYSINGSANINGRSMGNKRSKGRDSEVVVATYDDAMAQSLTRRFAEEVGQTRRVTMQELARESFLLNLKQWGLSSLAWMF